MSSTVFSDQPACAPINKVHLEVPDAVVLGGDVELDVDAGPSADFFQYLERSGTATSGRSSCGIVPGRESIEEGRHMHRTKSLTAALVVGSVLAFAGSAAADPPDTVPGGRASTTIRTSTSAAFRATRRSAAAAVDRGIDAWHRRGGKRGPVGRGPPAVYATVGDGPDAFWLQARIHGNELHSTEAVLQILRTWPIAAARRPSGSVTRSPSS